MKTRIYAAPAVKGLTKYNVISKIIALISAYVGLVQTMKVELAYV